SSSSRQARRLSSLLAMPTAAKRLPMVPGDSSMAMMPLPAATRACAVVASSSMLMGVPGYDTRGPASIGCRPPSTRPGLELAQPFGAACLAHPRQAQGVGGAVGFHVFAAGEHDPLAGREQPLFDQPADAAACRLARGLPAGVVADREHFAHQ